MIADLLKETGTQKELAKRLNVSTSEVSMVKSGQRSFPKECNPVISEICHRAGLEVAERETGGLIGNLFAYHPGVDVHPTALGLMVKVEFTEALQALEELLMAKMTPQEKQKAVERTLMEIEDAVDVANAMKGQVAKQFGIDLKQLNQKRKDQIRRGERMI